MSAFWQDVQTEMEDDFAKVSAEGDRICADVAEWLYQEYGEPTSPKAGAFHKALVDLEQKCVVAVAGGVPDDNRIIDVPMTTSNRSSSGILQTWRIRLWQLGYTEDSSIRGAASMADIMAIVQKCILKENETEKYPLEVLFGLNGTAAPGDALKPFQAGISVGSATASAAFVIAHCAIKYKWDKHPEWPAFAIKLLKCLRLTVSWEPAGSLSEQIQKSVHNKIQAAARSRPSVIQMHFAPQP
jgi:hypothetical protein